MKCYTLFVLSALFMLVACTTPTAKEEVTASLPPFNPAKVETLIRQFEQDTSLQMKGAFPNFAEGIKEYQWSENQEGIRKYYKFYRNINGSRERTYYFDSKNGQLIFAEDKRIRKACPSLDEVCLSLQQSYYEAGILRQVNAFKDTIRAGNYPSFDKADLEPVLGSLDAFEAETSKNFLSLQEEQDTVGLQVGQRIKGEYIYFADAASFVACSDQERYDVESYELEKAYIKQNYDSQAALTQLIGYYTTLPNMENRPTPHLIVLKLLKMEGEPKCE